jgi:alkaline phosphatase D
LLGCITSDSVKIWIRTTKPAEVEVQIEEEGKRRTFGPVPSTLESDLTAIVAVTGLKPGTSIKYTVRVDGKEIPLSGHAMIVTPVAGGEAETRIAFGTCPHRKGLGNPEQAEQILKFKPHAMLIYGDIAVQDRGRHIGLHRADYALRDFHPAWKDLASRVPFSASWDDHDYCNNDGFGINANFTDADRRQVRKVFSQAWNNPYYGMGDEGGGIFTHTRMGCCDVIMTDNRYFRERVEKGSTGKKNGFLGPQQMEWLKKTLLACKGPFIIVTCGTMWDDVAAKGKDSWGIYDPEGREEIYQFIEKNKIPGVLFLSGDRHGARIFRIPRPAGHEFYEFEVATLGGLSSITAATNPEWKTQLFGQMNIYAHGQFIFDPSGDDPTVTHRLIQADGQKLFELVLKRSQLTPK